MDGHWNAQVRQPYPSLLPSPIEESIDNISDIHNKTMAGIAPVAKMQSEMPVASHLLATPPVSPSFVLMKATADRESQSQGSQDPQLFPSTQVASATAQVPLFPSFSTELHKSHSHKRDNSVVQAEKAQRSRLPSPSPEVTGRQLAPASQEEAALWINFLDGVGYFTSQVYRAHAHNPAAYTKRVLQENNLASRRPKPKGTVSRVSRPILATVSAGVKKVRKVNPPSAPVSQSERQQSRALASISENAVEHRRRPSTSSTSPRIQKPNTKDDDWRKLANYCPPRETLSEAPYFDNERCMDVKWAGNPFDNSNDPDRAFLHDAEARVARVLRLTCAQYLACKRHIFAEKLKTLQAGKGFTKTHAQQACKVDVNKASQLYNAFNSVGWFQESHFRQWLRN